MPFGSIVELGFYFSYSKYNGIFVSRISFFLFRSYLLEQFFYSSKLDSQSI